MSALWLESRETLRAGIIGVVAIGTFVASFMSARDPESLANRATARYVKSLRGHLVSMFVFLDVRPVVVGQFLAVYLIVAAVMTGADPRLMIGIPLVAALPWLVLARMRQKRTARLSEQADAFVLALSSAMRSTPSIGDAFISISTVVTEPLRKEIELAIKQMRVGATLEEALLSMGARINSRAFDTALTTVLLGQRLGGDVPSTLAKTGAAIRELNRLDRFARARLSSAKTQMRVIGLVPIALPLTIERVFPGYFDALRTHPFGWVAIVVTLGLWIAALVIGRRILSVTP